MPNFDELSNNWQAILNGSNVSNNLNNAKWSETSPLLKDVTTENYEIKLLPERLNDNKNQIRLLPFKSNDSYQIKLL